jgi:eukaryotic-like serine/threonine-protein kinase
MKTIRLCPSCCSPVPADAPDGLCPSCLLKTTVTTDSGGGAPSQAAASAPAAPSVGKMFGDYRIIRLLGQGGMGDVYEAEHVKTGRHLALKVMNHALGSEQDRKRFLREGRLAASVNHPNVVYIYGSEEIGGAPVIAMELVQAGTLRDQLKREGFLKPPQAVEAVLQIIAGLEAAEKAGVLHRDIKPANCFLDASGVLKVGDFGLSVSTIARKESLVTAAGSVLGTPAYASPEQLRGQSLDPASDIYSIGATLYHLLTGRVPFEEPDFVKLITQVLDAQPAPPNSLRPEIPVELSRVVMRCLAKDRKARYQTYDQLRQALLPFRSAPAVPAPPARRFLAGLLDEVLAYGPSLLFLGYWSLDPADIMMRERTTRSILIWLGFRLWYVLYFAIFEGRTGAGLGKLICGLRVAGPGGQAPGFLRALWRTTIYLLPNEIPHLLIMACMSMDAMHAVLARGGSLLPDKIWFITPFVVFVTMRKSNGYAAIHDLLSGARVVVAPKLQTRPGMNLSLQTSAHLDAPGETAPVFGPYQVQSCLWKNEQEQLWEAFDPALRRKIWIHVASESAAPVSKSRRELNRPARLHWLNSGRANGQLWNAYQACDGAAFPTVPQSARTWASVRFWLLDLAEEISAALKSSGSAPALSLDRVWIDTSGRALLLDFRGPGLGNEASQPNPAPISTVADMQHFLGCFSKECLGDLAAQTGGASLQNKNVAKFRSLVPVHAQGFLVSLARGTLAEPEFIVGNLTSLISKPARITRAWRAASVAFTPVVVLGFSFLICGMVYFEQFRADRRWNKLYPTLPPPGPVAQLYQQRVKHAGKKGERDLELMRVYVRQHLGLLLTNDVLWTNKVLAANFDEDQRQLLREAVSNAPPATPDMVAEAETVVGPSVLGWRTMLVQVSFLGMIVFATAFFALVEFLGCAILGQSLALRLFGLTVLSRDGWPATRARVLWRWIVIWLPMAALGLPTAGLAIVAILAREYMLLPAIHTQMDFVSTFGCIGVSAVTFILLGCLIHAVLHPERSIADWLAQTKLAPL